MSKKNHCLHCLSIRKLLPASNSSLTAANWIRRSHTAHLPQLSGPSRRHRHALCAVVSTYDE